MAPAAEAARAEAEAARLLPRLAEALRLELRAGIATGLIDEHMVTLERGKRAPRAARHAPALPALRVRVAARRPRDLCSTVYALPPPPYSWRTAEPLGPPEDLWYSGDGSLARLRVFLDGDLPAQLRQLAELEPAVSDAGVTALLALRRAPAEPAATSISTSTSAATSISTSTAAAADGSAAAKARRRPPESLPEHKLQLPVDQAALSLDEILAHLHALVALERAAARAAAGQRIPLVDEAAEAAPALRAAVDELGLTFSTCPLGFFGDIEGYRIDAHRFTMVRHRCILMIDLELPQHLPGKPWQLWSSGRRFWGRFSSGLATFFGLRPRHPKTGDFALDRRFLLMSGDLEPARERLRQLREPLIAHADHHWLALSNHQLRLALRVPPTLTAGDVVTLVRDGVELARMLGGAAERRALAGPYR